MKGESRLDAPAFLWIKFLGYYAGPEPRIQFNVLAKISHDDLVGEFFRRPRLRHQYYRCTGPQLEEFDIKDTVKPFS